MDLERRLEEQAKVLSSYPFNLFSHAFCVQSLNQAEQLYTEIDRSWKIKFATLQKVRRRIFSFFLQFLPATPRSLPPLACFFLRKQEIGKTNINSK
jgi:phospholipid N-methyltransferase